MDALTQIVLAVLGSFFVVAIAWKAFSLWQQNDVEQAVGMFFFAIFVAAFVYLPEQSIGLLKTVAGTVIEWLKGRAGSGTPTNPNPTQGG